MGQAQGHIQLQRAVASIMIGHRHRTDLGEIDALAASIAKLGLLQPPTITTDGTLVCGARRLAAVKQLGWRTVDMWVRSRSSRMRMPGSSGVPGSNSGEPRPAASRLRLPP